MTRVRVVKSQIAGTATRAWAQVFWRAAMTSTGTAAQYAAPRNAAVIGGTTVHAKYVPVWAENTVSWNPARKTRKLAAYNSHRIHAVKDRTPGEDSGLGWGSVVRRATASRLRRVSTRAQRFSLYAPFSHRRASASKSSGDRR